MRPTGQRVHAANGSVIEILGETEIEFSIGGRMSGATVLVSPDVSELMLGITWLTEIEVSGTLPIAHCILKVKR